MPIIKSAKKRMRQNAVRKARRTPFKSELKTTYKKALEMIKKGQAAELEKFMAHAFSVIDTACKKNIIHANNAARKKSRLARGLNALTAKKKPAAKKEEKAA